MAGKHDVWVFKDGVTYKVRPAVAFGDAGRPFKVRNLTDNTLNVKFPKGPMVEKSGTIEPRKSETFRVAHDADGLYHYEVEVVRRGLNKKAVGESGPEIIIDP